MTIVASETSKPTGIQAQNCVVPTEQTPGKQTGNETVPFVSYSNE